MRRSESPRRHHRPRRKRRSLPERGWIQLLTLRIIHEEPMHGYKLINEMEEREFVELGRFMTGSIYTILNRMEKRELLTSENKEADSGRIRRVYSITEKGEGVLVKGLKAMIKRKKIADELSDYYNKIFLDSKRESSNVDLE